MANQLYENEIHAYVEERLSAYIDKQLSDAERVLIEKHLQACERCTASLRSMEWTINLLKQSPAPALPRSFALPVPKQAPAKSFGWSFGLAFAGVAAVLVVAIFTATYLLTPKANTIALAPVPAAAKETAMKENQSSAEGTATPDSNAQTKSANDQSVATGVPATRAPTATPMLAPLVAQPTPTTIAQPASPSSNAGVTIETTPPLRTLNTQKTIRGQVISDTLAVHEGPDSAFRELGRLKRGDNVDILGRDKQGEWYVIRLSTPSPETGWVDARGIIIPTNDPIPTIIIPSRTPTPTATPHE